MKKFTVLMLLTAVFFKTLAQDVSLSKGWKFETGDSARWAAPDYNDQHWQPVDVSQNWEKQGHPNYNGFGWYRNHVVIPSSLKENAFIKDSLRISLAEVDDNDEVYLNGKLIAKYGGRTTGDIKSGNYGPRVYTIAVNNPAILWDKENILAVRIYDTGGDGGMYGSNFHIMMADIMDQVTINTDADFDYGDRNSLNKVIKLLTTTSYNYQGKLNFKVTDPENGTVLYEKNNDAAFTGGRPFSYSFQIARLEKKSYTVTYTFTDTKSGKQITKSETTPYVLTPYPSSKPRINGADVFGARPNHPVLYLVPATGHKPLSYQASGLPDGLRLDPATGIISGMTSQAGNYPVSLTVSNRLGSKTGVYGQWFAGWSPLRSGDWYYQRHDEPGR